MDSSNDANADTGKNLNVPFIVLTVLVALTGMIDFSFGVILQFAPEIFAAEFGVEYVPELKGLISVFGISTLFWGLATLVSARWIWKRKLAGLIIGALSGAKLLFASLATFA